MEGKALIPYEVIEQRIFMIRDKRVMIDKDLAELYGVETKYLNRQVKRNKERFPAEFMFQLNRKEKGELVTNWHRFEMMKHSNTLPFAFTEHGVAMLSSVLGSRKAVRISIFIVKTFIRLRRLIETHRDINHKVDELERKVKSHDTEIRSIFEAIRQMIIVSEKPKKRIGFCQD
jgi:hypothetical protein